MAVPTPLLPDLDYHLQRHWPQPEAWTHTIPTTLATYQLLGPLNHPLYPREDDNVDSDDNKPLLRSKYNHDVLHSGEDRSAESMSPAGE